MNKKLRNTKVWNDGVDSGGVRFMVHYTIYWIFLEQIVVVVLEKFARREYGKQTLNWLFETFTNNDVTVYKRTIRNFSSLHF